MKNHVIALFTLIALISFSCQKEVIRPASDNNTPEISASTGHEGHYRPAVQCGASVFTDFIDNAATGYGSIEVLNDNKNLYVLVDMNHGWLLQSAMIFADNSANLPKAYGGTIEIEEFPFQFMHTRQVSEFTYSIPLSSINTCSDITIYAQAVQLDFFGNVQNTATLWADGTSVLDGFTFQYCAGTCLAGQNDTGSMN